MSNPSRALTTKRGALHKTGSPHLLRAMALSYLKTFDEEVVAAEFDTTSRVVRRVLSRPDIQEYLSKRMIPIQNLAETGAKRLLEEALKTAFNDDVDWKERTENRKLLARSLLPEIKKISVEHNHYIRAPARETDADEWAKKFQPDDIVEAEIIEDE